MAENIGEFSEMLTNLSPLTLQDLYYPFTKHFPPKTLIAEFTNVLSCTNVFHYMLSCILTSVNKMLC